MAITFPPALPVSQRVDEIAAAIDAHQVVVVAGETGSGKTTQLPKICLQLGRRMIGHTQPRRLAARAVADRIATELGEELGATVGYQVRFTERVGEQTRVKLMTDGILLAELAGDRMLRRYDTIIVDEAHERSLNIDFLLGYLSWLLPRRRDLKLVITSATIDPQRFADHFGRLLGAPVPVLEVSGRTYPVEIRYRPPDEDTDMVEAIADAVRELAREGPGDMLVFLSGEREIRDTADALRKVVRDEPLLANTEILPLYARLSLAEQHKVFTSHRHRRIVLATNVAETSLTVPGIRYVIDPGFARISRYSHRLKVQRLPIEPISQASAIQRAGRCGRVADGICIRLYSEEDFASRPAFTEPEILRTNLASVILQMADLRLGEVTEFPFLDPPDRRQVSDGVRLLEELGAIEPLRGRRARRGRPDSGRAADQGRADAKGDTQGGGGPAGYRLTPLGHRLARLPVDPRLARMVLEADRQGCLKEVLVIASALSIQDPRERPTDRREAADTAHARFADERSDFLAYLNLWEYLQTKQKELSGNQFRRMCRDEFLNFLRVREWQDVHEQLRRTARTLGASLNSAPADPDRIHIALLSGLLSHLGRRDLESNDPRKRREYIGARNARFAIAPGSVLFKRSPDWVMVAELVETTRLWGRVAAAVKPEWVEPLAEHLVTRTYSELHWDRKRGGAVAYERVTLYGLPIVPRRRVDYARIDPRAARELFIRHALVEQDWDTHHRFFHDNAAVREQAAALEDRARRRDIVADDEVIFDFYDQRIPADVVSAAHFDRWWKQQRRRTPDLLTLDLDRLVGGRAGGVGPEDFPDTWRLGEVTLPLSYRFEPGDPDDGVTVEVPLMLLDRAATEARFDWHVPGMRRELVTALIRSLPRVVRRAFVPVPEVADRVLAEVGPSSGPLLPAVAGALSRIAGATVTPDEFDLSRVPEHLWMRVRVVGADGRVVAEGRDVAALRRELRGAARRALAAAAGDLERDDVRDWDFGTLPREVTVGEHRVTGYPALVDEGGRVALRVLPTAAEQARRHAAGVRRLLLRTCPSPVAYVSDRLARDAKLVLLRNPHGGVRALLDDCAGCAVDALVAEAGGPPWDQDAFAALRRHVRTRLDRATLGVVTEVLPVLKTAHEVEDMLAQLTAPGLADAVEDVRRQLAELLPAGFVTDTGWQRLPDLRRYVEAAKLRLQRLPQRPERDRQLMADIHEVRDEYLRRRPPGPDPAWDRIRWAVEELRVSLFAQQLGTRVPVSVERVQRAMDALS